MVVHDKTQSAHQIELTAQSDDEKTFVNELAALLMNGGCVKLFSSYEAEKHYLCIAFDGGAKELMAGDVLGNTD